MSRVTITLNSFPASSGGATPSYFTSAQGSELTASTPFQKGCNAQIFWTTPSTMLDSNSFQMQRKDEKLTIATTATTTRSRHPQYYFEDGIVFLVEDTYYKVPRRKLCLSSSVFQDLFTLPPDSSFPPEGESDERPIFLQGISNIDFERLLTYLYPLTTEYTRFTKEWTFDYWHSILKVAHTYMMEDICAQMIDALSTMSFPDPLTMIHCGLKFGHPAWIRQGYSELVFRSSPLSVEEAQTLGLENSILCAAARETFRSLGGNSVSKSYPLTPLTYFYSEDINRALDKWFTGQNQLPHEPCFELESPVYDLRAEV